MNDGQVSSPLHRLKPSRLSHKALLPVFGAQPKPRVLRPDGGTAKFLLSQLAPLECRWPRKLVHATTKSLMS